MVISHIIDGIYAVEKKRKRTDAYSSQRIVAHMHRGDVWVATVMDAAKTVEKRLATMRQTTRERICAHEQEQWRVTGWSVGMMNWPTTTHQATHHRTPLAAQMSIRAIALGKWPQRKRRQGLATLEGRKKK